MTILLPLALQAAGIDPAVLDRIAATPPPVCSVTLMVEVDEVGDTMDRLEYRYDGRADSWSFVAFNGGPPPPDEIEEFEERGRDGGDRSDDPLPPAAYYADSVEKLSPSWDRLSPNDQSGAILYGLETLPKGTVIANGRDLSANIRLRYLIDYGPAGPRLVSAGGELKKRWRIPLIARIDEFEIDRRFAPAGPDSGAPGAMLPASEHVEIAADVLGKNRSAVIDTVFSDWDCQSADKLAASVLTER